MTRWEDQAACKGKTDAFFPKGATPTATKALCDTCPVIAPCRALALQLQALGDLYGYWGGMTRAERIAITGRHCGAWWPSHD